MISEIQESIFGSFIEHIENCIEKGIFWDGNPLSDDNGIRRDVVEKCKEMSPSVLRFPGGTVMGIYHWEDYVGPVNERKKVKNIVWGGRLTPEFGTCEYISLCREIGAEPMICVNMPTGTAEEAANWVEFCNGTEDTYYANLRRSCGYEEPFNVKYWCIGNESFAEPDLGVQHDVTTYIREAWEYTKYMKMTDPEIELVFVGHDDAWNKAVLDSLGAVCDYLSIHHYGMGDNLIEQNELFEAKLVELGQMLDDYNSRGIELDRWYRIPPRSHDIRIALDEWNIWNTDSDQNSQYGLQQRYTWKDALWVAKFMNLFIRHSKHVGIANLAQMVNVIGAVIAEEDCCWKQTIFYPFAYYRRYCGSRLISYNTQGTDWILTDGSNGKTLLAVNYDSENMEIELPFEPEQIITLSASDILGVNDAAVDIVSVDNRVPDIISIIPAYSIRIYCSNKEK